MKLLAIALALIIIDLLAGCRARKPFDYHLHQEMVDLCGQVQPMSTSCVESVTRAKMQAQKHA